MVILRMLRVGREHERPKKSLFCVYMEHVCGSVVRHDEECRDRAQRRGMASAKKRGFIESFSKRLRRFRPRTSVRTLAVDGRGRGAFHSPPHRLQRSQLWLPRPCGQNPEWETRRKR
mmetsp:Transcript_23818/g.71072  ORF Transcript_23818/g.71072 Transcript_23818/m.71072 type:complete len:117 (-) Transcript_23818:954-1304(-)